MKKGKKSLIERIGFTNYLALVIIGLLAVGLGGGFILAWRCISTGYVGALVCWTVVFTPIGTACSFVLPKIVEKSKAENTKTKDGEGIKYAVAMKEYEMKKDWQSPKI